MKVYYSTPYAPDGNIGRALNEFCASVPGDSDWICLRDGDTMWLTPNWGRHIEEVLETHGDRYALFGAMTNRIRSVHQRVPGMFDEMDLRHHAEIAGKLEKEQWGHVIPARSVAGFFMCFRKDTWSKIKFRERDVAFDTLFSRGVMRSGGRIGLMQGLYILHAYRIWSESPLTDVKHLDIVGRGVKHLF